MGKSYRPPNSPDKTNVKTVAAINCSDKLNHNFLLLVEDLNLPDVYFHCLVCSAGSGSTSWAFVSAVPQKGWSEHVGQPTRRKEASSTSAVDWPPNNEPRAIYLFKFSASFKLEHWGA